MKDYLAAKRNELLDHENTQKKFTCMLLMKRSPSENAACFMIAVKRHSKNKRQNYEDNQMISC